MRPGSNDFGLECFVHGELTVAERGLHFFEGADSQDALPRHGYGGGFRVAALHGQDLLCRVDSHWQRGTQWPTPVLHANHCQGRVQRPVGNGRGG